MFSGFSSFSVFWSSLSTFAMNKVHNLKKILENWRKIDLYISWDLSNRSFVTRKGLLWLYLVVICSNLFKYISSNCLCSLLFFNFLWYWAKIGITIAIINKKNSYIVELTRIVLPLKSSYICSSFGCVHASLNTIVYTPFLFLSEYFPIVS